MVVVDEQRLKLWAQEKCLEYIDELHEVFFCERALAAFGVERVQAYKMYPVSFEAGRLRLAVYSEKQLEKVDDISHELQLVVEPCVAEKASVLKAIQYYVKRGPVLEQYQEVSEPQATFEDKYSAVEIQQYVLKLLEVAWRKRASDVHIEPMKEGYRLRFRVDGQLMEYAHISRKVAKALVVTLKLKARMDIAEKRMPQDGNALFELKDREVQVRVASMPSVLGEQLALRLFREDYYVLSALGLGDEACREVIRWLERSEGLILATGTTGAGKTTTLYAMIDYLNTGEKKIVTIEDPIERTIARVSQIQLQSEIEITFASALRSVLRQAPDVIMVGEIRDSETASVAVHAALTGHSVLSSLHTNDAWGSIGRLKNLGVEPYLLAAALKGVVGQKLVGKVCFECKGEGCIRCRDTGYYGRTGEFELLAVDDAIRARILEGCPMNIRGF